MKDAKQAVRIRLNPDAEHAAEVRVRLNPSPEVAEESEALLTMLGELSRTRHFISARWREAHPVKARHALKALRQIEGQILAELEGLYEAPVEIDPPTADAPASQPASVMEETMGQVEQQSNININSDGTEPGRFKRGLQATWGFVKKPKVWGVAVAVAGIGIVYAIVKMAGGGGEEPHAAAPGGGGEPAAPVDTAVGA